MIWAFRHPPRKQFLTIDAEKLLDDPYRYIDVKVQWIDRPEVES
jgi:hypothetical protein